MKINRIRISVAGLLLGAVLAACGTPITTPTEPTSLAATEPTSLAATEPTSLAATEPTSLAATEPTSLAATEPTSLAATEPTSLAATEPTSLAVVPAVSGKLNLNTVTGDELLSTIPGFGNRMVREFQEYRPYTSILQFRREMGKYVDDATIAEYEKYVFVPITVGSTDVATIQQIPGLTTEEAQALIDGAYTSNEIFLQAAAQYLTPEELAVAATYLGS